MCNLALDGNKRHGNPKKCEVVGGVTEHCLKKMYAFK